MQNQRIFLSSPHMSGNEKIYINEAFDTNWIAPLGPNVDHFEEEMSDYIGSKGAVAVSSGTAAIHLALELLEVKSGDCVFCSSLTFIASANPIMYQGAEPIFIDSEVETWNMSPIALEKAFKDAQGTGRMPKAVIVVNLFGQSAKMDEILTICNYYNVPIIEDAAESLGATYKGKQTGTLGKLGVYSFNGNKIITTSGGGMIVSDDIELLKKAKFLATQARDPAIHYQHSKVGYNYRMSNIIAGIGRAQLQVLDDRVKMRREIFKHYTEALKHLDGITFMPELEGTRSNRWLTAILIDERKLNINPVNIVQELEKENIEARPLWKPLHIQPVFKGTKYYSHGEKESISEFLYHSGICLPSGSNMTMEEQNEVIKYLKENLIGKIRA
ncbi:MULTISPECIES: DegT/DnrJ/EryC1/StrS family aminotransferase [Bacillus]|uniref:DegT/DnrJ/EryC1/StrS family aminotransferase n=1 Tax=Bacillus TaxID=1386 RepID=UPI0002D2409A|nr:MULTISPECIES: DegT/DnrJ/EryC1/StrS family aminotransferase [Bacillus]MEB9335604.1 DegT/DnrJ/EryC1/StrS family aminotransferase [Bacillus cereus]CCW04724.1 4-keto-6-deoxy-N-Acetyl-D-hexosaminyl-(Lipid carrier) aminotransferase [Bacillus sp. GeD10]HEF1856268.1 DegT/DnrJ/EryC1/StrS family aminotransferase [Bacillus cereus]HEF1868652.1 DegT/DnrJ/EryC1/StrS family aminotransferase [Bacillus cereus]HEF1879156.1 DegT/DnrJ/EryC1/StrS family aminotransferase [Bacillus cereus]